MTDADRVGERRRGLFRRRSCCSVRRLADKRLRLPPRLQQHACSEPLGIGQCLLRHIVRQKEDTMCDVRRNGRNPGITDIRSDPGEARRPRGR